MGIDNDLDVVQAISEDHRKRIALEEYAAGSMQVWRAKERMELQDSIGITKSFV